MGISRDSRHKRRASGGKRAIHQKKRKHELGRPPSNTKLGGNKIHLVRCRGGNLKYRALRLDTGNFSWGSEQKSCKSKIIAVVYNAVSNELVRTNTITKGTIVLVDATPFRQFYHEYYGVELGKKRADEEHAEEATKAEATKAAEKVDLTKLSAEEKSKIRRREKYEARAAKEKEMRVSKRKLETGLEEQFATGRLLACVTSRPGQSGRADGYILEGKELDFYKKKMDKKKKN